MLDPNNKQANLIFWWKYRKTDKLNKHYWKLCLEELP